MRLRVQDLSRLILGICYQCKSSCLGFFVSSIDPKFRCYVCPQVPWNSFVVFQAEYYFSDENLPNDKHMMSLVKKNKEGFGKSPNFRNLI